MQEHLILLANVASTLVMTGVIWFVQVVHYPLFAGVGANGYGGYHSDHSRRTARVVALPMLAELATSFLLSARPPAGVPAWQTWLGSALAGAIWLSTFLLQVPCHRRLSNGYDREAHRSLVTTNWFRTAAWSIRSLLVLWMLAEVMHR